MPAIQNFRTNLETALGLAGMSQRELARQAGVSFTYVNRILRGKTEPTLPQCERLAATAGHDLPDLLADPKKFLRTNRRAS